MLDVWLVATVAVLGFRVTALVDVRGPVLELEIFCVAEAELADAELKAARRFGLKYLVKLQCQPTAQSSKLRKWYTYKCIAPEPPHHSAALPVQT